MLCHFTTINKYETTVTENHSVNHVGLRSKSIVFTFLNLCVCMCVSAFVGGGLKTASTSMTLCNCKLTYGCVTHLLSKKV